MNFSFLCLGVDMTPDMQTAQDLILKEFSQAYTGDFHFENFGSENKFMDGLHKAVEDSDIIVLTVRADLFPAFKDFIGGQFQFKPKPQKTIRRLIVGTYPDMEKDEVLRQAAIPSKADAIISQDGLYSGYALRTDTQILIVLPLDPSRLDYLLEDGVLPYLRDNLEVTSDSDRLKDLKPVKQKGKKKKKARTAWNGVPEKPQAAAAPEAITPEEVEQDEAAEEAVPAPKHAGRKSADYNADYIQGVLEKLRADDTTVTLADTKTLDFIRQMADDGIRFDDVLSFGTFQFDRGDRPADTYAAQLSKGAFENGSATLGASITKVISRKLDNGKTEYNIYCSIYDGTKAKEAHVTGAKGESPQQLIFRGIEVLFHMIALWDEEKQSAAAVADAEVAATKNAEASEAAEAEPVPEKVAPVEESAPVEERPVNRPPLRKKGSRRLHKRSSRPNATPSACRRQSARRRRPRRPRRLPSRPGIRINKQYKFTNRIVPFRRDAAFLVSSSILAGRGG